MNNLKKYMPRLISVVMAFIKHIAVIVQYVVVQYLFFFITGIKNYSPDALLFYKQLIIIFVYINVSFGFAVYNRQQSFRFLSKNTKDILPDFFTFDFLCDIVAFVLFFLVFTFEMNSPIAFIIALISNIINPALARLIWLKDKEDKASTRFFEIKLVSHMIFSTAALFLFFFFAASLIPAVATIVMIFRMLTYLTFLPVGFVVIIYLLAIKKMHTFLKEMKRFCIKNNIEYTPPHSPYLSIFKNRPDNVFEININGKEYSCSLLSFANIYYPVVFRSDGFFYRNTKNNIKNNAKPTIALEWRYTHETDKPQIVILTSAPLMIMVQLGNKLKFFDTGDMCGKTKIFTMQGFIGAVERNTLDRKSFE